MIIDFLFNVAQIVFAIFLAINVIIILLYIIVAILTALNEFVFFIIDSVKERFTKNKKGGN